MQLSNQLSNVLAVRVSDAIVRSLRARALEDALPVTTLARLLIVRGLRRPEADLERERSPRKERPPVGEEPAVVK